MIRHPPRSTLFPYTPLSRSMQTHQPPCPPRTLSKSWPPLAPPQSFSASAVRGPQLLPIPPPHCLPHHPIFFSDRKSTRLNSSHLVISYAVFCLKKKKLLLPSELPAFATRAATLASRLAVTTDGPKLWSRYSQPTGFVGCASCEQRLCRRTARVT